MPLLVDLIPRYEAAQHGLGRRPDGVRQYIYSLHRFTAWCGEASTTVDLTRQRILDYRDFLGLAHASASIINELAVVSSFCDFLVERELLQVNPCYGVARPKKKGPAPDPLSPEEVATLLEAIVRPSGLTMESDYVWRRNRRIIYLMLFAGFRRSDCMVLRWQHVDFAGEIMQLVGDTKGGKPRRVAMHPDLIAELRITPEYERQPHFAVCGLATGKALSRGGIEHVFDIWLEKDLRIDDKLGTHLHPHKLRTTFATYFAWSTGGDVLTLQKLLGHNDPKTTTYYVLNDDTEKRRQIKKLRFERPKDD